MEQNVCRDANVCKFQVFPTFARYANVESIVKNHSMSKKHGLERNMKYVSNIIVKIYYTMTVLDAYILMPHNNSEHASHFCTHLCSVFQNHYCWHNFLSFIKFIYFVLLLYSILNN